VNLGFKHNLINQSSIYTGFTPNLSLSAGKIPFIYTESSLLIVYHCFTIYKEKFSACAEQFSNLRESFCAFDVTICALAELFCALGEIICAFGEIICAFGDSFCALGESFCALGELTSAGQKPFRLHQKLLLTTNHGYLLRGKALISGYKAFGFVPTLFPKWNGAFPFGRELGR